MKRTINNKEIHTEKLLKFMQYESENHGELALQVIFNFSPSYPSRSIPAGEDLLNLCEQGAINEDRVFEAIRSALARKLIKRSNYYPNLSSDLENPETNIYMQLTQEGYSYALSIDGGVLDVLVKEVKGSKEYTEEKRKGGSNSYQKYKPLRNKVFELCELELKKKKYSSAEQLCKKVAKVIEEQHSPLLGNFEPYQLVLADGGDWLKPTFYGWCNKIYKGK